MRAVNFVTRSLTVCYWTECLAHYTGFLYNCYTTRTELNNNFKNLMILWTWFCSLPIPCSHTELYIVISQNPGPCMHIVCISCRLVACTSTCMISTCSPTSSMPREMVKIVSNSRFWVKFSEPYIGPTHTLQKEMRFLYHCWNILRWN